MSRQALRITFLVPLFCISLSSITHADTQIINPDPAVVGQQVLLTDQTSFPATEFVLYDFVIDGNPNQIFNNEFTQNIFDTRRTLNICHCIRRNQCNLISIEYRYNRIERCSSPEPSTDDDASRLLRPRLHGPSSSQPRDAPGLIG
jgi:hypothetical protein